MTLEVLLGTFEAHLQRRHSVEFLAREAARLSNKSSRPALVRGSGASSSALDFTAESRVSRGSRALLPPVNR